MAVFILFDVLCMQSYIVVIVFSCFLGDIIRSLS